MCRQGYNSRSLGNSHNLTWHSHSTGYSFQLTAKHKNEKHIYTTKKIRTKLDY